MEELPEKHDKGWISKVSGIGVGSGSERSKNVYIKPLEGSYSIDFKAYLAY